MPDPAKLLRTPLSQVHEELGARMVDFAGWHMPVQYTGVIEEHRAVRRAAGLFDLSHMGEFIVSGPDAQANLQHLLSNDISDLSPGKAQYTLLLNDKGGIVDDLLIYALAPDEYLLVVNAANISKDRNWIQARLTGHAAFDDRSDVTALIAIQGPQSPAILQRHASVDLSTIPPFGFVRAEVAGCNAIISRTGYTGEEGFELFIANQDAVNMWHTLLSDGESDGLVPVGLGARDTLRLEAGLCLYGNELTEETSPLEAGLAPFVKLDKGAFIGREALLRQKDVGVQRVLRGFIMEERGIPRHGHLIYANESGGEPIGRVTSGTFSPTREESIGLCYVDSAYSSLDTPVWIDIRGKRKRARIAKRRFI